MTKVVYANINSKNTIQNNLQENINVDRLLQRLRFQKASNVKNELNVLKYLIEKHGVQESLMIFYDMKQQDYMYTEELAKKNK